MTRIFRFLFTDGFCEEGGVWEIGDLRTQTNSLRYKEERAMNARLRTRNSGQVGVSGFADALPDLQADYKAAESLVSFICL